eukprot:TRINITY_DN9278_c0_g1_i3.p1 TRINITY_DN9278_c0_g1~~TRINITY_DN9278_c0_g1_i3.p1  ORF type:complete len:113 (-),score=18.22 TRINITY_DN9278_c0_g1_i3:81-419(-)
MDLATLRASQTTQMTEDTSALELPFELTNIVISHLPQNPSTFSMVARVRTKMAAIVATSRATLRKRLFRQYATTDLDKLAVHFGRAAKIGDCLLYTSPSPRDRTRSRMPSSA